MTQNVAFLIFQFWLLRPIFSFEFVKSSPKLTIFGILRNGCPLKIQFASLATFSLIFKHRDNSRQHKYAKQEMQRIVLSCKILECHVQEVLPQQDNNKAWSNLTDQLQQHLEKYLRVYFQVRPVEKITTSVCLLHNFYSNSKCLKITQNVSFEFQNFVIFHQFLSN